MELFFPLLLATLMLLGALSILIRAVWKDKSIRQMIKDGDDVAESNSTPSFLTIPGEIRNEIYRLILVSDETISISKSRPSEPALLSTCRPIHKEATPIYYCENTWELDYVDWDYTAFRAFHQVLAERAIPDLDEGMRVWNNTGTMLKKKTLLKFMKVMHEDGHLSFFEHDTDEEDDDVVAITGAFAIADYMKEQPWEEIERVLEIYLREVVRLSGWEWECECDDSTTDV